MAEALGWGCVDIAQGWLGSACHVGRIKLFFFTAVTVIDGLVNLSYI